MMSRKKISEQMEFIGGQPKNLSIVRCIRDHGYLGVMFNKEDFMDAVVWSANVLHEYGIFFNLNRQAQIVIPIEELPIDKNDLENAHMIMLVYYNMKENFVLVEKIKQSLYTVARFQKIEDDDAALMKQIGERMNERAKRSELDFNFDDMSGLPGAEKKINYYSSRVTKHIEKYMKQCVIAIGL